MYQMIKLFKLYWWSYRVKDSMGLSHHWGRSASPLLMWLNVGENRPISRYVYRIGLNRQISQYVNRIISSSQNTWETKFKRAQSLFSGPLIPSGCCFLWFFFAVYYSVDHSVAVVQRYVLYIYGNKIIEWCSIIRKVLWLLFDQIHRTLTSMVVSSYATNTSSSVLHFQKVFSFFVLQTFGGQESFL